MYLVFLNNIVKVISEIFWKYLGMSSKSVKRANNTGLRGPRVGEFVFVNKIKKEVCTSIHTSSLLSHCTFLNVHFSKNLTFFYLKSIFWPFKSVLEASNYGIYYTTLCIDATMLKFRKHICSSFT